VRRQARGTLSLRHLHCRRRTAHRPNGSSMHHPLSYAHWNWQRLHRPLTAAASRRRSLEVACPHNAPLHRNNPLVLPLPSPPPPPPLRVSRHHDLRFLLRGQPRGPHRCLWRCSHHAAPHRLPFRHRRRRHIRLRPRHGKEMLAKRAIVMPDPATVVAVSTTIGQRAVVELAYSGAAAHAVARLSAAAMTMSTEAAG